MTPRSTHLLDAVVIGLVGAVIALGGVVHGGDGSHPLAIALGLVAAASLVLRRRAPGWTLAMTGALALLLLHVDASAGAVAVLAPAIALYSLALRRGPAAKTVAAAVAVVAVVVADLLHTGGPTVLQTVAHVLLVAIPLLMADLHRTRHANIALLRERLELAEHTREQEARHRAEQERMRIARELHDVVAHTLTTINVQAATTAAILDRDPTRARPALEAIENASRDAIAELRAILGVLRTGDDAPLSPAPGIDDIAELTRAAGADGVDVELAIVGERPASVPDAVAVAAYRIVQESITNARRHAAGASIRVALRFGPRELGVVVDNGTGVHANGNRTAPGVGITGMRERAVALGGTLLAAAEGNGFRVQAELPYALNDSR